MIYKKIYRNKKPYRTLYFLLIYFYIFFNAQASSLSEPDYKKIWGDVEEKFNKEYLLKADEEEAKENIKLYFEMGKNSFEKKDYATALLLFKKVLEVEEKLDDKKYTNETKEFITQIENIIKKQTEEEIEQLILQDLTRYKSGINARLRRIPRQNIIVASKNTKEDKNIAKKQEIEKKLKKSQKISNEELLDTKLKINEELYRKKLEATKRQIKINSMINYANECLRKRNFLEAIKQADEVLSLDPENLVAQKIKHKATLILDRQKLILEQKMQKEKEKIELLKEKEKQAKEKQLERKISSHLAKGKELFENKKYIDAIDEFKQVLLLQPQNSEARSYLLQIKSYLDKAIESVREEQ